MDSSVRGDRVVAYSRHALYPLLLVPAFALGGYSGALVVSVLGLVGAAIAGAFLARRLDIRYAIPTLWIIGVGSPLVFDGYVLWGHSVVAASAALAYLGLLRGVESRSQWMHLGYALPAVVLTVLLRSEGPPFVIAVAIVLGVGAVDIRRQRVADRWAASIAIGTVSLALASYWFDTKLSEWVGGSGYGTKVSNLVLSERSSPIRAVWTSLLKPYHWTPDLSDTLIQSSLVFLVLGALAFRWSVRFTSVPWVLITMSALGWTAAVVVAPADGSTLIPGLFAAFPLLSVGLLMTKWIDVRESRELVRALGVFVVTGVLLLITIYGGGGGTDWGGRFFHITLVPLVGPMLLVIQRRTRSLTATERRVLCIPMALLVLAPSVLALGWIDGRKQDVRRENDQLVSMATATTIAPARPLVVVWRLQPDGTSRLFWDRTDDLDVLRFIELDQLSELLEQGAVRRRGAVTVVSDLSPEMFGFVVGRGGLPDDWEVDRRGAWTDGQLHIFTIRPHRAM
jgi:hypothetical protein